MSLCFELSVSRGPDCAVQIFHDVEFHGCVANKAEEAHLRSSNWSRACNALLIHGCGHDELHRKGRSVFGWLSSSIASFVPTSLLHSIHFSEQDPQLKA